MTFLINFTILATIKTYIPYIISIISLVISVITNYKSKQRNSYLTIDAQYKELLGKGMSTPIVRNSEFACNYASYKESDPEKYYAYCSYAYMMWNFLETTYDLGNKRNKNYIKNVWEPVVLEENKLHYRWFLDNRHLFREEFQKYVIEYLNEVEIKEGDMKDFKKVYDYITKEFPKDEVKTQEQMTYLLIKGIYNLAILRFAHRSNADDSIIGYALYCKDKENTMMFLDYINIIKEYQGCRYGSKFLELLNETLDDENGKGILLEIEPPTDAHTQQREKFYIKNGAYKLDFDYFLPTQEGSIPMNLMIIPTVDCDYISKEDIKKSLKDSVSKIHGDYKHTGKVIEKYLNEVKDFSKVEYYSLTLGECSENELPLILKLMSVDFSRDLQINSNRIKELLATGKYHLLIIKDRKTRNFIAYAFVYEGDNKEFALVDYLSIPDMYVKENLGEIVIKLLKRKYRNFKYGIYVEMPTIEETHPMVKTIKSGNAVFVPFDYFYPVKDRIINLQLAVLPNDGVNFIPKESMLSMIKEAQEFIHADSEATKECIKKNSDTVRNIEIKKED